jgi:hypothetical protein
MEAYRRILELVANGQVQSCIEEQSDPDFHYYRALYEGRYLAGHDVSAKDQANGGAYWGLRITRKGRNYLQWLAQAFQANRP